MKHEPKHCPRCNHLFECKVGSVGLCQCAAIKMNEAELDYIRSKYNDCVCAGCMKEIKREFHQEILNGQLKILLRRTTS